MQIKNLNARASSLILVFLGVAVICLGFFLSKRVSALAADIEKQNAETQAALIYGQINQQRNIQHSLK